jgi:hypothetical protein
MTNRVERRAIRCLAADLAHAIRFSFDPVILSDNTSARFLAVEHLREQSGPVDFLVERLPHPSERPAVGREVQVAPAVVVLVGLHDGPVLEVDAVHPHEVPDLLGGEREQGTPIGKAVHL